MIQNKFMCDSSLTNLEYKPREIMAENYIVCKTIRQKINAVLYDIRC